MESASKLELNSVLCASEISGQTSKKHPHTEIIFALLEWNPVSGLWLCLTRTLRAEAQFSKLTHPIVIIIA